MVGLFLRWPHFWATSSGWFSLNSPSSPTQEMQSLASLSVSNSSRNCHSWICPLLPGTRTFVKHHIYVLQRNKYDKPKTEAQKSVLLILNNRQVDWHLHTLLYLRLKTDLMNKHKVRVPAQLPVRLPGELRSSPEMRGALGPRLCFRTLMAVGVFTWAGIICTAVSQMEKLEVKKNKKTTGSLGFSCSTVGILCNKRNPVGSSSQRSVLVDAYVDQSWRWRPLLIGPGLPTRLK